MATTDRLTPWNNKYNFSALRPGYDYHPNGPHRDLELAQVVNATLFANECIRKLIGGTLGLTKRKSSLPEGIEAINRAALDGASLYGPKWFIPVPLKEVWAECPRCGTMNHFVRTANIGQYFLCSKCR
jgi:hypothetical protein